jgi:ABC-2 type transport system permease protein
MRNIWTISQRELKLYFSSPIAYVVAFIIYVVLGILFYANVAAATSQIYGSNSGYVPNVQVVIGPLVTLALFSIPAITMRTLAEEQKMGTLELLLTSPVRDWEVVVGKWLGAFLYMSLVIAVTILFPILLNRMVSPGIDQGLMVSGYLGLWLLVGAFIALGVMISSFFSNQITAFFATLGLLLVVWMISYPIQAAGGTGDHLLSYLDFSEHFYNSFYIGVIEIKDVVFYISAIAIALMVGSVSVEMRRWR